MADQYTYLIKTGFTFVGVVNSLLLSVYLLFRKFGKKSTNIFLSLILVAISLRIGKSLVYHIMYPEYPRFLITLLGHFSMSVIGPLVYFFYLSILKPKFKLKLIHLTHFIFAFMVLPVNTYLMKKGLFYLLRHGFILAQTLIYLLLSLFLLVKFYRKIPDNDKAINKNKFIWWFAFLFMVFLIVLGYFLYHIFKWVTPFMYIFCVFIMLYLFVSRPGFYISSTFFTFKKSVLDPDESKKIFKKILTKYERSKVFLDPELTLSKLAKSLNIKPYKISKVINAKTKSSFIEFTNKFRIKEAERMLNEEKTRGQSILYISYDCGFNSWSAFSSAFKKINRCSPTEFRSHHGH